MQAPASSLPSLLSIDSLPSLLSIDSLPSLPSLDDLAAARARGAHVWARWAAMWNGDLALAADLIADGFVVHLPRTSITDPATLRDAGTVAPWVARFRAQHQRLAYTTSAGPFVDAAAGAVTASWFADGIDAAGAPFRKAGLDLLRLDAAGRVVECWTFNHEVAPRA